MGFFDSKMFQDFLAMVIILGFLLAFYSMFRKQKMKDTMEQIKEWYRGLDGDGEND